MMRNEFLLNGMVLCRAALLLKAKSGFARAMEVTAGFWPVTTPSATNRGRLRGDGWLHTGDLAVLDNEGYASITGRAKDVIIRGGENTYPREVEDFLYTCPGVSAVQVVGVPDKKYGEQVVALIKLQEGSKLKVADIQEFCEGKIARFKIPRIIQLVDEFPMTVTGKVQKYKIREQLIHELGLESEAKSGGA
jgi:fatty-acyl-CoA synthase